jgi:hypothetical protein
MLLVTINPMGMVFVTKINGEIDEELDTTDCAVRVLHAMQEHGFAVQQMLVVDTSTRFTERCLTMTCGLGMTARNDGEERWVVVRATRALRGPETE